MYHAKRCLFALCLLLIRFKESYCQGSLSPTLSVLEGERKFLKILKEYIETTEENNKSLKKYLDHCNTLYNSKDKNYEDFLSHPLNSYYLMRRTAVDVGDILNFTVQPPAKKFEDAIQNLIENKELPSREDMAMATNSLLAVQSTYELDIAALSKGILQSQFFPIMSTLNSEPLEAYDGTLLTVSALLSLELKSAISWGSFASSKKKKNYFTFIPQETIEYTASAFSQILGLITVALSMADEERVPTPEEVIKEKFKELCRDPEPKFHLKCKNFEGHHPYYKLQPIRLEEVSDNPFIAVLHDVISVEEMETLKILAYSKFKTVSSADQNGTFQITNISAKVSSSSNEIIRNIDRKLSMMTGLNTEESDGSGEKFQVSYFGSGGFYPLQNDSFSEEYLESRRKKGIKEDNRIASIAYFLSDVKAGGSTAFPKIDISVLPKKGSALFWWNLNSNGDMDKNTLNAGCPVIYGNKWVAQKWIRESGQMFIKKCSKIPGTTFQEI